MPLKSSDHALPYFAGLVTQHCTTTGICCHSNSISMLLPYLGGTSLLMETTLTNQPAGLQSSQVQVQSPTKLQSILSEYLSRNIIASSQICLHLLGSAQLTCWCVTARIPGWIALRRASTRESGSKMVLEPGESCCDSTSVTSLHHQSKESIGLESQSNTWEG